MGQPRVQTQPEQKRTKNFQEVSLGYPKRLAQEESRRCPQCSDPVCQAACPLGVDIPGFIRLLREGDAAGAYQIIRRVNVLPSICGRICSAPCEAACVLNDENAPIGIRALERYASDFGRSKQARREPAVRKGKKVAIVGSGPAGLAAASDLAQKGFQVTLFEALDQPGGVLRYGIPEFRIPREQLAYEIHEVKLLGVRIETNFFIGKTATIDDLKKEGYSSVLLAMGAGVPKFMSIRGTQLGGVYYGEEFLMRVNQRKEESSSFMLGEKVVVIGSGNTALDCARAVKRLGREVSLVFRRTEDDMRVRDEERLFAKEEGVRFEPLLKPMEILPNQNNFTDGLKCIRMDYADEENSGAWKLVPVEDSEFIMPCDTVVMAVGHRPNTYLAQAHPDLSLNEDGSIQIDPQTFQTSIDDVFACGNVVTNAGPVVEAIGAGKRCAQAMEQILR